MHRIKTIPTFSPTAHLWVQPLDYWRVKRIVKMIKPDVVHGHYLLNYGFRAASCGVHPLILTPWGDDILIKAKASKLSKYEARFALHKADLVTCTSNLMVEELVHLGTARDKIEIVYVGTDIAKFRPGPDNRGLRERLGIWDSPAVISTRNLEPVYNVESLVNAVPMVLREVPRAKFVIVGKGSEERKVKSLGRSLGVADSIKWVGSVPSDELPHYLRLADVYVSTSLSDGGLAASTAEAMACALPVVISDFGDNKQWVKDGVNGFVVPIRNPEALASRITWLIKNEDLRRAFGKVNRQIISDGYNSDIEMKKMETLYIKLIERVKE